MSRYISNLIEGSIKVTFVGLFAFGLALGISYVLSLFLDVSTAVIAASLVVITVFTIWFAGWYLNLLDRLDATDEPLNTVWAALVVIVFVFAAAMVLTLWVFFDRNVLVRVYFVYVLILMTVTLWRTMSAPTGDRNHPRYLRWLLSGVYACAIFTALWQFGIGPERQRLLTITDADLIQNVLPEDAVPTAEAAQDMDAPFPSPAQQTLPLIEVQDEVTHYMYARDALQPGNFVRLVLDEWGRPGNLLTYLIPSQFSLSSRRIVSVVLLILTTAEATSLALTLFTRTRDAEDDNSAAANQSTSGWRDWFVPLVLFLTVPIFLWLQPWYLYYGSQSLTQVPFMFFLTAAVTAWVQGRYIAATFFFSLLPITRHEALPLLVLWLIYLYRRAILRFVGSVLIEIFNPPGGDTAGQRKWLTNCENLDQLNLMPDDLSEEETRLAKREQGRNGYAFFSLLPYVIWNFGSLAYRNGMPLQSLFGDQSNPAYQGESFASFFIAVQNWTGLVVMPIFVAAIIYGVLLALALLIQQLRSDNVNMSDLFCQLVKRPGLWERYTWWTFYAAFFAIHVYIITLGDNPFASGGYDFFILPIAPAIAVVCAASIVWIFWKHYPNQDQGTQFILGVVFAVSAIIFIMGGTQNSDLAFSWRSNWVPLPETGDDRQAMVAHTLRVNTLTGVLPASLEGTAAPIITINPLLRLWLEEESDQMRANLCPYNLWDIDPQMPFYPNLFPAGSHLILDGTTGRGLPTATLSDGPLDETTFSLQAHELAHILQPLSGATPTPDDSVEPGSTSSLERVDPFRDWMDGEFTIAELDTTLDQNVAPFEENVGFAVLRQQPESLRQDGPKRAFINVDEDTYQRYLSLYYGRYCGYNTDAPPTYAVVQGESLVVYRNLMLPQSVPLQLAPPQWPPGDPILHLPAGSRVPVLECVLVDGIEPRSENRNSPLYCLIVFPDTNYAYDVAAKAYPPQADEERTGQGRFCNFNSPRNRAPAALPVIPPEVDGDDARLVPPRVMAPGCFGWIWLGENVTLIGQAPRAVERPELASFGTGAATEEGR